MPYALSNRLDVTGDPLLGVTETLKVNTASFRTTAKEFRVRVKRNYGTAGGRRQPREPMTRNDKGVPRNRESRILPAFVSRVRMNLRISALAGWLAVAFLLRLPAPTRRGFFGVTSNCLLVSNDGSCFTGARLSLRLGLIVPPQADAERPSARAKCTTRAFALSTEPYIPISPYLHISMPQGQGLCGSAGSNDPCGRAGDEPGGGADGGGGGPKNAGRQDAKSWEKSSWGNISAR